MREVPADQPDQPSISKPLKEKTTKAERRALQEAQRAAKAASKGCSIYNLFHFLIFYHDKLKFIEMVV